MSLQTSIFYVPPLATIDQYGNELSISRGNLRSFVPKSIRHNDDNYIVNYLNLEQNLYIDLVDLKWQCTFKYTILPMLYKMIPNDIANIIMKYSCEDILLP